MHTSNKRFLLLGTVACLALVACLTSGAPADIPQGCSRSSKSINNQLLDLSNLVDPTGKLSEYIRNSLPLVEPAVTSDVPRENTKDLASDASGQVTTIVASTEVATPSTTPSALSSPVTSESSTSPGSNNSEPMRSDVSAPVSPSSTVTSEVQPTTSGPSSTAATPVEVKASNITVNVILQLEPDAKTDELINNPNILIPSLAVSNPPAISEPAPVITASIISSTVASVDSSSTTSAPLSSITDATAIKIANETTTPTSLKMASQTTGALLRRRRDVGSVNVTEVRSTADSAIISPTSASSTTDAIVGTSSTSGLSATDAFVTSTTSTTTTPAPTTTPANATSTSTVDTVSSTTSASTTTTITITSATAPSSTGAPSSSQLDGAASEQVSTTVTTSNSSGLVSGNRTTNSSSPVSSVAADTSSSLVVEISAKDLPLPSSEQGTTVATVEIVVSPITNSSVNNETKILPTNYTLESSVAKAADVMPTPLPVLLPLLKDASVATVSVVAQQPANQKDIAGMLTEDMQEIASKLTETCLGHGQQPVNIEPLLKKNKRLQLGYASLDSSDPHSMINDPAAVDNLNVIYDNDTSLHIPGTTEGKPSESSTRSPNKQRPIQSTKFVINEPTEESERENYATCALEANLATAKVPQLNQIGRLNFWQPIHQRGALHMLARFRYSKRSSDEVPVQSLARSKRESFRVPIEQMPGDGSQPIGKLVKHPIWLSRESCANESTEPRNRSLLAEVSPTSTSDQLVDADVEMLLARFNLDEGTNGIINKYLTVELPSGQPLACCQVISVPIIVATELENMPSVSVVQPTGLHTNKPEVTS